jgi:hypothetical protein
MLKLSAVYFEIISCFILSMSADYNLSNLVISCCLTAEKTFVSADYNLSSCYQLSDCWLVGALTFGQLSLELRC